MRTFSAKIIDAARAKGHMQDEYEGYPEVMDIVILGIGYVGLTAACCITREGHSVTGIDVSHDKVAAMQAGIPPIIEPQIRELMSEALAAGRLKAQTEIGNSLEQADIAIVCVGTPSGPDGSHNMRYIVDVTRQIADSLPEGRDKILTVAYRSTFRPGTVEELVIPIFETQLGPDWQNRVEIVYNPEFLREGSAVEDYFAPPKIVVGTHDAQPSANMDALHEGIDAPTFHVRFRTAEFTKFADNTWHAVKVAYANELGRICLDLGVSPADMHEIFVSDTKLNVSPYYLRPGGPFGGSCLPKDVRALQHIAGDIGASTHLIDSLLRSNEAHKHRLFLHATAGLKDGARVLLAGLAFKADTDDLRESPNVDLARKLLAAGYQLDIFDPAVNARKLVGANLGYAYTQLPRLQKLLVDKATAEKTAYARVIATNATARQLQLPAGTEWVDLGNLSAVMATKTGPA
jgi:GDP-mannose 6-dehydrogenase